jgi:hypothetical protein
MIALVAKVYYLLKIRVKLGEASAEFALFSL